MIRPIVQSPRLSPFHHEAVKEAKILHASREVLIGLSNRLDDVVEERSAPRAPSRTRWSQDSVSVSIGRIPTGISAPGIGTTRSVMAPTARIPAWGGTMIAVN